MVKSGKLAAAKNMFPSRIGSFRRRQKAVHNSAELQEEHVSIDELLPIGSVVLLKDGEKKLMIIGILQNDIDNSGKNFDYLGVLYPEGHVSDEFRFLFNHDDIEKVFFRGFEDEERIDFIDRLRHTDFGH